MSERIFNFSAGPAVIPLEVLEKARSEMLSLPGLGFGVMEMSHRSPEFESILTGAENGLRELLRIPDNFRILFLHGGASLQFSMVPMNLLPEGGSADYVQTGSWSEKAVAEARKLGKVNIVFSSRDTGYRRVPEPSELNFDAEAAYVHYCSNETIHGVQFKYDVGARGRHVVCDASSDILSKPIDVSNYSLIYAGAQKNIGPPGVAVAIVREDLLGLVREGLPSMLDYRLIADNGSMLNTPNTWGIYMIGLVCDWLKEQGGVEGISERNKSKAAILYDAIDSSGGFYSGHADRDSRSDMNVTFRLPDENLEMKFLASCRDRGFSGLAGHRSVGGVRASIYNAFPVEGVEALAALMKEFRDNN